jgi:hypothetical protein
VKRHELLQTPLPEDKPLRVVLRPVARISTQWDIVPANVEADGRFVRSGVMPGSYRVEVFQMPKGMALGEVRYNGNVAERGLVTLNAGALDHKLELVLWPATASIAVMARQGTKAGADALLAAWREPADPSDPLVGFSFAIADGEGRGTLAGLMAGKYRVLAFPPESEWLTDARLAEHLARAKVVELEVGGAQMVEVKVVE